MKILTVNTKSSYNIYIGKETSLISDINQEIEKLIIQNIKKIVIIIDKNVSANYKNLIAVITNELKVDCHIVIKKITEQLKTRRTKEKIEDTLFEFGCNRSTALIAIGGGVLLDLVGFVAATFCRGIPVIYFATSLLAMVDASIGGKTGLNTTYGKNLIGVIKQPNAVFININDIYTLSDMDFKSAIAEIIKVAIVFDKELFQYLIDNNDKILSKNLDCLKRIIVRAIEIKAYVVENDELELNYRQLLNFGHTLGHAIEKIENYKINHGYAVALGIWLEVHLSYHYGVLNKNDFGKIIGLLKLYYKNSIRIYNVDVSLDNFYNLLYFDKKTIGLEPRFILVDKIGSYYNKNNSCSHVVNKNKVQDIIKMYNHSLELMNHA